MPDVVGVPFMPVRDLDPSTWTVQPGTTDRMHTLVVGPGPNVALPLAEQAAQARLVEVPMANSGGGTTVKLRDYQIEAIDAVHDAWARGAKAPLIVLPTACHRAGQGVLMYDGSVKAVEDVVVGDLLLGPDSTPRTVLDLHRGSALMYEIVPLKGAPFVVTGEHLLTLYRTPASDPPRFQCHESALVDVSVREVLSKSATWRHRHKLIRASAVSFSPPSAAASIDPYFLGLYLADGSMAIDGMVAVSKPDPEVLATCQDVALAWGLRLSTSVSKGGCPSHHFTAHAWSGRPGSNPLLSELRRLGLMKIPSEERFVPDHYKTGSVETRLSLLAGILDGDGHLHRTDFDFVSKSQRLANDVAFIARSLGLAAYITPCRKGCQGGFVGDYFRVCISGVTDKLPMRIPRKIPPQRKMKKNPLVVGFAIRELGDEPFFGFTLDGDHRYLLDDFTVTHNSGKTIISAEIMARVYKGSGEKSLFIAHRDELLSQTMDKVRLVSPDTRVGLVRAKNNEVGREITVASIQTIGHKGGARLKKLLEHGPYSAVIIDEAHHAVGAQYMKVIAALREANPNMLLMGVTATPGRSDGIALDRVFDVVAYEKNMFEMIRDGWLVPPHGFRVDIDIDLDKVDVGDGDYVVTQLSKLMNTPHVNRAVVEAWRAYGHDRKCIVFACDVAHSHALAQEFIDAGHPAAAVDGKMKDKDRKEVLNRFREGSIKLLVNCNVLTEGYDDPSAEGVVFARPTQSQSLYIQCLDYQTEILTKRGWVGPQTVRDDDIVATMDPDTERCVWSPILSRVDRPMHEREKMYALKLPGIDIRVTGNHRMIYKQRRNKKPMWTVASQMPKCFTAIVSVAEPEDAQDCPGINDADLTLLGWWYAEGSWNRANNALVLYQGVRSRFVKEIERSLSKCGLKFGRQHKKYDTEFKKNHEMFMWYVSYGTPRGAHKDKRGWKYLDRWVSRDGTKKPTEAFHELSARQWRIFLEAFNKGDGARRESASIDWKPQTWSIYQKPGTGLHDMFQALCLTRGMRCNLSEHANGRGRGFSRLSIAPDKRYHTINGSRSELTMREVERAPDERVWCVETSTGTIITRRNGKAAVVGNCIGRGLRLYPGKTECLVIDCVGNSEKHRPVQLASLAGFDPERKYAGNRGFGNGDEKWEGDEEQVEQTEVTGAKIVDSTEVTFGVRKPKGQYQWRETTLGWILQIPRIGYYLVAWSDKATRMATIRFFDQRSGRRHMPPREIVRQPIEFDLAYGLVESEMDRIFRARSLRRDEGDKLDNELSAVSFVDLDEGTDEDIIIPDEELMLKDAAWRERPVSPKQRDLLLSLGVKERTMPGTAGEASDLITIMRVERDMKMRLPATLKQINYLRFHGLPLGENLTKGMAARAIWMHRKATGR
jgi:superfamily II DNA or RNA helicase